MKKSSLMLAAAATAALSGAPAKSQAEPIQDLTARETAAIINLSPDGVTVPLGGDASVGVTRSGVFGTAVGGRGVIGNVDSAVGLKADFNGKAQHITATGAQRFTLGTVPVVASIVASGAREDAELATGFHRTPSQGTQVAGVAGVAIDNSGSDTVNLQGQQFTLGLDTKGIGPIKTMGVSATKGKTKDALLENREELSTTDRVVNTGTTTDIYADIYKTNTATRYLGSEFTRYLAHATMDVGTQGELAVSGGREHNSLFGDKTVWGVRGTAYLGTAGKLSVHTGELAAGQKQTGVEYTYPLSREVSLRGEYSETKRASSGTEGVVDERRAALNLVWTPGANGRYDRPSGNQALSAKNIAGENLSNPGYEIRNLGNYGKVETTVSAPVLKSSTLKSSTLNKPSLDTIPLALSVVGADVIATFASSMPKVTYECRIDGGTAAPCTSPKTFNGLANGNHIIEVRPVNTTRNPKTGMDETVLGDWISSSATVAVNTALQIGNVSCTATSITVGDTTTCTITPVDPQGISSVTATIDGSPATVTGVGTYSVVLTGLAAGNYTLTWSVAGKNPDGSPESVQTASQTIVVSAAPVTPDAPSCTADDTANTISCGAIDPTTLQMSVNGGSWQDFEATGHTGTQTVLVRVKAQGINPASAPTTLNFTENYVVPTLPTSLPDILVGDGGGSNVPFSINMPTLTDAEGNQISYTVNGLPTVDGSVVPQPITWSITQVGATINITCNQMFFGAGASNNITTYPLSVTSGSATGSTTVNLQIVTQ